MRLGLTIARLSAAGWVGAASLFVVTAVREVMHPGFDSVTKDALVLLRFPAYYVFGFSLVGVAFVAALGASCLQSDSRRRTWIASGLLALVLLLMAADFVTVYSPMAEMITPPGRAHVAEFQSYHRLSMWLNVGHVGLCAIAAVLLCWPGDRTAVAAGSSVE
jgi:hypothetical protein